LIVNHAEGVPSILVESAPKTFAGKEYPRVPGGVAADPVSFREPVSASEPEILISYAATPVRASTD
jgi:hypothetical protein